MKENFGYEVKGSNNAVDHERNSMEKDMVQISERLAILEEKNACMEKDITEMRKSIRQLLEWAEAVYEFETSRLNAHHK